MRCCLWDKELTRGQAMMIPEKRKRLGCGRKLCTKWKECVEQPEPKEVGK